MASNIYHRIGTVLLLLITILETHAQQLLPVNQQTYADSLTRIVTSKTSDSLKANANYLLSDYWRSTDSVKSKSYLNEGKKLSKNYPYLQAVYYFYKGQYFFNKDKIKAANSFKEAQKHLLQFNGASSLLMQAASWYNYAIMRKDEKGYPFVMNILTKYSIPLAKKAGNNQKLSHYYSQFGTILMYNGQFEQAAEYNKLAIDLLSSSSPNSTELVLAYIAASNNYIYANKKSLAKEMLYAAKKILKPYPNSVNYPIYYLNEAQFNIYTQNFTEALNSVDKGVLLAKKYNQNALLQLLYFRKYEAFLNLKHYHLAKKQLLLINKEGIFTKDVNNRKTMYNQLVSINELMNNKEEAYLWLQKYSTLSDSISAANLAETVRTLESKFHNRENKINIEKLNNEKAKQTLELNQQKTYMWLAIGIGLLFFIVSIFSYLLYLNNKKLIRQKELNHQQEIDRIKEQEQLKITRAILDGEEKERERIAKDLHDGLGGMLAVVKIKFSGWSSKNLDVEQRADFENILNQLDLSVSELRGVARNLMPESLLKFGLEIALKDLIGFFRTENREIDLQTYYIQKDIVLSTQLNIYRIVQELLSNAIKHSEATMILVQCTQATDNFLITFEDNGKGFVKEAALLKNGMGMKNIQNRVNYLGGVLEIESILGEGTTINIELKINEK
ncbi:MAG: sensor histidine kinase [Flavobacterium sp.]